VGRTAWPLVVRHGRVRVRELAAYAPGNERMKEGGSATGPGHFFFSASGVPLLSLACPRARDSAARPSRVHLEALPLVLS